jgi:hypothetical protein
MMSMQMLGGGETGIVCGLSTAPKYSQSNELDLIIWIEWDHS